MLAYEPFRPQQYLHQTYDSENDSINAYPPTTMESFDFNIAAYNPTSFSYYDVPSTYVEAPLNESYNMTRSASSGSTKISTQARSPTLLSSESIGSATSSTVGSPYPAHAHLVPNHQEYGVLSHNFMAAPAILDDGYTPDFIISQLDGDLTFPEPHPKLTSTYVDPVLLSGSRNAYYNITQYPTTDSFSQPPQPALSYSTASSPAPSAHSYHSFKDPVTLNNYNQTQRSTSVSSQRLGNSPQPSLSSDDENCEKGRCTFPECGRIIKDLRAHMLTHQAERPMKCPILNCEYNQKGFARKYDKNRHTLTHYKGTMVCGFCPGSGSPAEKSFNRADVFKRHLTIVHGVEQNPPNSRKRSPSKSNMKLASYCADATGRCSTCSATFHNAQDFYEHLDDCVLRVVQQEVPSEAINAQRLAEVASDIDVQETFERHMIKMEDEFSPLEDHEDDGEEDMDDDEDNEDEEDSFNGKSSKSVLRSARAAGARVVVGGGITKTAKSGRKSTMTWSKGGVSLVGKGRKRRKHYPPSWGLSAEKMRMKKRVLCVYDGSHRLLKDDMMLHNEFEVRMRLPDSNHYVTDLDMETLKRANAFHDATPEEKGAWIPQQDYLDDLMG